MKVTTYMGMSGTLKGHFFNKTDGVKLISPTKDCMKFDYEHLAWSSGFNPLAALLIRRYAIQALLNTGIQSDFVIERSVLDFLYMFEVNKFRKDIEHVEELVFPRNLLEEEMNLFPEGTEFRNVLFVNTVPQFVEHCLNCEPTRRITFKSVDDYFEKQEKYLQFIKKYMEPEIVYLDENVLKEEIGYAVTDMCNGI